MKKTPLLTSLMAAVVMMLLAPFSAMADKHTNVTMAEFLKMPADKRLEVCAAHVDSEALGACMNLKHSDMRAAHVSYERIELEMMRCVQEGKANPEDAAACARSRLNKGSTDTPNFTEKQFKAAEMVCKKKISDSKEIGSCMSAVLPHIDAKGNYH